MAETKKKKTSNTVYTVLGVLAGLAAVTGLVLGPITSNHRYTRMEVERIADLTNSCSDLGGVVKIVDGAPFYRDHRLKTVECTIPGHPEFSEEE